LYDFLRVGDLAAFLGGAVVVAHPSQAEGFGLPVLEAMACGAPVLTTRALSLPEVGGEAVEYAEPDVDGIAAALRRLLDDPARRESLRQAGRRRAEGFLWSTSASAHVAAYEAATATARA
jgi:glycosyltransferase involved in cell wall biosynthesis